MWDDNEILRLCSGRKDALELIRMMWQIAEVWDDILDGDKRKPDDQINETFLWVLFGLGRNPIWREHAEVRAAARQAIGNWLVANRMEKSGDREQVITAYTLRCSPYDFFVSVVMAVSGAAMADEAALYFRSMPTADRLEDYLHEHLGDRHGMGTESTRA